MVSQERLRPAAIVVITDGLTPWPDAPPGVPVTIAAVTTDWTLHRVPPWMQAIDLTTEGEWADE